MDKELLQYLRDMARELSTLAEEGDFASLSRILGMAALEADQRLGPALAYSREEPQADGLLTVKDDLGHADLKPGPVN
jgi:hypothetical protein